MICPRCSDDKAIEDFNKGRGYCRSCRKEYGKQWRDDHEGYGKEYYIKNAEHLRTLSRDWHKENRDRCNENQRKYMKTHPDVVYRKNHRPGKAAIRAKSCEKWRRGHPEYMEIKRARISLGPAGLRHDIPIEIVELKVLVTRLRREVREKKEEQNG